MLNSSFSAGRFYICNFQSGQQQFTQQQQQQQFGQQQQQQQFDQQQFTQQQQFRKLHYENCILYSLVHDCIKQIYYPWNALPH